MNAPGTRGYRNMRIITHYQEDSIMVIVEQEVVVRRAAGLLGSSPAHSKKSEGGPVCL